MRPPHPFVLSQFFQYSNVDDVVRAVAGTVTDAELTRLRELASRGLPPITSKTVLAAMMGINPGLLWSFEYRTRRHYRRFLIPKGTGHRVILAPRVALKLLQRWLAHQLQQNSQFPDHVFGFVPTLSHVDAAKVHANARWVYSVDIENFFPSTPERMVRAVYSSLGYGEDVSHFLARISCLDGVLPQGAPTSPVLSNYCLAKVDAALIQIAADKRIRLSRYADDIVFSGEGEVPEGLPVETAAIFSGTPWTLSARKTELAEHPRRLKVHGLLVHGDQVRLTKGYRNRIRAYKHLISAGKIEGDDLLKVNGHIEYSNFVEKKASENNP